MHQRLESIPKLGTCVTGLLNFSAGFAIATAFNCWSVHVICSTVLCTWTQYGSNLITTRHCLAPPCAPRMAEALPSVCFLFAFLAASSCLPYLLFYLDRITILIDFLILGFVVSGNHISEPGTSRRSLFCLWQGTDTVSCVPLLRWCLYRASESRVVTK